MDVRGGVVCWCRSAALVAAVCGAVVGCFRWEPAPPAEPAAGPPSVWVGYVEARRLDGSAVRLARARLSADSLVGRRAGLVSSARVAIPRDSLAGLARRRLDPRRSALAAGAMVLLAVVAFTAAAPFTPH